MARFYLQKYRGCAFPRETDPAAMAAVSSQMNIIARIPLLQDGLNRLRDGAALLRRIRNQAAVEDILLLFEYLFYGQRFIF